MIVSCSPSRVPEVMLLVHVDLLLDPVLAHGLQQRPLTHAARHGAGADKGRGQSRGKQWAEVRSLCVSAALPSLLQVYCGHRVHSRVSWNLSQSIYLCEGSPVYLRHWLCPDPFPILCLMCSISLTGS